MTKLTVLMPVYNVASYIKEAVDSVLNQSFHDYELLIINDGATDGTKKIIESYNDSRIRLICQENKGVAEALNTGLQFARGEFIARFDGDDICLPGRLEKQVSFLEQNPEYVLIGGEAEYMDQSGQHLFHYKCIAYTHEEIMNTISSHCPFIHASVMYRKDAVMKAGGYPPHAHNFEDHLLWIQMIRYGNYCNLPLQLVKVRINPASATIDEKWRGRRFRRLKNHILQKGTVTADEGADLMRMIKIQDTPKIKLGAYHALCGKKFLLDNYQPAKARRHLATAIRIHPSRPDNYIFYMLSFFPGSFLKWLHQKFE